MNRSSGSNSGKRVAAKEERARDKVDAAQMWKLVREVATKHSPSNAPLSMLPAAMQELYTCAPTDHNELARQSIASTRSFRVASRLPCYMSVMEVGALNMLGASFARNMNTAGGIKDATKATAAAYRLLYTKSLSSDVKKAINTELVKYRNTAITDDDYLSLANLFRQTFALDAANRAQTWPTDAFKYADAWQKAFRSTREEAESWSAFLFTAASCGVLERDANFTRNLARSVAGVGSGNTQTIAQFVREANALSEKRTVDDIKNATRATLLQASNVHKHMGERQFLAKINAL